MMKRSYIVYGKSTDQKPVETEVKAKSAMQAIEIANNLGDGNTYESARKRGCSCGGTK